MTIWSNLYMPALGRFEQNLSRSVIWYCIWTFPYLSNQNDSEKDNLLKVSTHQAIFSEV